VLAMVIMVVVVITVWMNRFTPTTSVAASHQTNNTQSCKQDP
jgi:hypothetical protein